MTSSPTRPTRATSSRGCHEDATRKLLPWNLSLIEHVIKRNDAVRSHHARMRGAVRVVWAASVLSTSCISASVGTVPYIAPQRLREPWLCSIWTGLYAHRPAPPSGAYFTQSFLHVNRSLTVITYDEIAALFTTFWLHVDMRFRFARRRITTVISTDCTSCNVGQSKLLPCSARFRSGFSTAN